MNGVQAAAVAIPMVCPRQRVSLRRNLEKLTVKALGGRAAASHSRIVYTALPFQIEIGATAWYLGGIVAAGHGNKGL